MNLNLSKARDGLWSQESLVNSVHLFSWAALSVRPLPELGPEAQEHTGESCREPAHSESSAVTVWLNWVPHPVGNAKVLPTETQNGPSWRSQVYTDTKCGPDLI